MRTLAITGVATAMLGCLPAGAQQAAPELDGAPGWRAAQDQATRRASSQQAEKKTAPAPDTLKAERARLAQQAKDQKAALARIETERTRLKQRTEELKELQARLDARAAEVAAEEKELADLRTNLEAAQASLAAEADQEEVSIAQSEGTAAPIFQLEEQSREADADRNVRFSDSRSPEPAWGDDFASSREARPGPTYARLDLNAAERACAQAAEHEALSRRFYTARYDRAPRLYLDYGWELRGPMRLQDRRGYLLVHTVCEVDVAGEVQRFDFLR